MEHPFTDRFAAGAALARLLERYAGRFDLLVLALPRGGVPVAYAIARALDAPLEVFLVRKLGVPGQEELAMGAIASGDILVRNESVIDALQVPEAIIATVAQAEGEELRRRERIYRAGRPAPDVANRTVLLVDDGLATGASLRAAIAALRRQQPAHLVAAVPVGAPETCEELRALVDEMVCAITPHRLGAIGYWYEDFSQLTDEEVCALLARAAQEYAAEHPGPSS